MKDKLVRFFRTRSMYGLNPFYSPSYIYAIWGKSFADGLCAGIHSKEPFKGFTSKQWSMIKRSASMVTFGQEEENE